MRKRKVYFGENRPRHLRAFWVPGNLSLRIRQRDFNQMLREHKYLRKQIQQGALVVHSSNYPGTRHHA